MIKVMKKELKKINVMTLRNGYALKVDGESYMYYNQQALLEGMLVRIGMDRQDEMTKDDLHAMVEAIKDGSAIKQLQEQIYKGRQRHKATAGADSGDADH